VLTLADLCFAFGDRERARCLYDRAVPFAHMIAAPYIATVCVGATARALGVLCHLLRRFGKAEHHFEQALALERKLESPPLIAQTAARYARMLRARGAAGDEARAAALLDEATRIAAEIGCALPLDCAQRFDASAAERAARVPATASQAGRSRVDP
jgi:hypothetical protein